MNISHVIFDLDGTLVDSSPGILAAFQAAFERTGRIPAHPLTSRIIGPPLNETLAILAKTADPEILTELAVAFKSYYDTDGYRQSLVFSKIPDILQILSSRRCPLYIATNKRIVPTRLMIEHLGWKDLFIEVASLDSITPAAVNKGELLVRLREKHSMNPDTTLYVGDRQEDFIAAQTAGVHFAAATWGYGDLSTDLGKLDLAQVLSVPRHRRHSRTVLSESSLASIAPVEPNRGAHLTNSSKVSTVSNLCHPTTEPGV